MHFWIRMLQDMTCASANRITYHSAINTVWSPFHKSFDVLRLRAGFESLSKQWNDLERRSYCETSLHLSVCLTPTLLSMGGGGADVCLHASCATFAVSQFKLLLNYNYHPCVQMTEAVVENLAANVRTCRLCVILRTGSSLLCCT